MSNCNNKIWVFSDANYDVEVIYDTDQVLHCKISSSQLQGHCVMSFVYAKCTPRERTELWNNLKLYTIADTPWCACGDFNIVAELSEREGGVAPNLSAMKDFSDCIRECELEDIGAMGLPFTWQGKDLRQRLDRFLFNNS